MKYIVQLLCQLNVLLCTVKSNYKDEAQMRKTKKKKSKRMKERHDPKLKKSKYSSEWVNQLEESLRVYNTCLGELIIYTVEQQEEGRQQEGQQYKKKKKKKTKRHRNEAIFTGLHEHRSCTIDTTDIFYEEYQAYPTHNITDKVLDEEGRQQELDEKGRQQELDGEGRKQERHLHKKKKKKRKYLNEASLPPIVTGILSTI